MSGATYLKLTQKTHELLETLPPFNKDEEYSITDLRKVKKELTGVEYPKVDIETKLIPHEEGSVKVTVYRPQNTKDQVLPAVVYLHGGGWSVEKTSNYPYICSKLAAEVHCAVIYVHYSLSPEVRFPVALEECYAVTAWYTHPKNTECVNPHLVAIAGDSSGGNLAISVTLLAKQRKLEIPIKYQVLFYPVTNDQFNTASYFEFGTNVNLTRKKMQFFWDQYCPEKDDRKNILVSPLRATKEDLEGLPPAYIVSAEADVIRDEAEDYARKLLHAKVPVYASRVMGVVHGFLVDPDLFCEDTLISLDMTVATLKRAFK